MRDVANIDIIFDNEKEMGEMTEEKSRIEESF